jgi:hypothetical protein
MTTISGYQQDTEGAWIEKDRLARLVYTMDWTEWLPTGATITNVSYSQNSRVNDADPIVIESQGISGGTVTYAELSGGTLTRTYIITALITLDSGEQDRRAFRVRVTNRIAR